MQRRFLNFRSIFFLDSQSSVDTRVYYATAHSTGDSDAGGQFGSSCGAKLIVGRRGHLVVRFRTKKLKKNSIAHGMPPNS